MDNSLKDITVCIYLLETEPIGYNPSWGIWKTSCGKRNLHKCGGWIYCPYCGKRIEMNDGFLDYVYK